MKWLRVLSYLFKTAFQSFRTSWGLQLMSIATLATAFVITGGIWLVLKNIRTAIDQAKGVQHISVYLKPNAPPQLFSDVQVKYCKRKYIQSCEWVSPENALQIFKKKNPDLQNAVETLAKNPFPASVEIEINPQFKEREELKDLVSSLKGIPGVEEVDDGGDWIDRWISFVKIFDAFVWVITLALGLGMIFMVSNTIQLVVYSRRDEVDILSLVGANSWMIRTPFIVEGLLQGILGSGLAFFALMGTFRLLGNYGLPDWSQFMISNAQFFSSLEVFLFLVFGASLGLVGSAFAVGRFLKL